MNLPCLRVVTWIWGWWNQPSSCRGSGHPSATAIWLRPVTTFWLRGRCTPLSGSQVVSLSPPVDAIYPPPPLLLRFRRQPVGWRVILHVANRQMPSGCSRAEWACPNGQAHSAREYLGGRSSLSRQMPSGCSRAEWACPNGQAHSAREYLGGRSSLSQVNKSSWIYLVSELWHEWLR